MGTSNMNSSFNITPVIIFLLSLVLISCASQIPCQYTATDGHHYDLSSLQSMADIAMGDLSLHENFYFGICRDAHGCRNSDAACSISTRNGFITSIGDLPTSRWIESYTQAGQGVSLQYLGPANQQCGSSVSTTIILVCDHNTDYHVIDFQPHCNSFLTIRSKHACPTQTKVPAATEHSDQESYYWIIGVAIAAVGLVAILLIICALIVFRVQRGRRTGSSDNLYQDMITDASMQELAAPAYANNFSSGVQYSFLTPGIDEV